MNHEKLSAILHMSVRIETSFGYRLVRDAFDDDRG